MALVPKLSHVAANAAADAVCAQLSNGYLRIYAGARPVDANTAVGPQTLLAELPFGAPAFTPAVEGVALATAIGSGLIVASADASWFRTVQSDGTTAVFDGTVGTSNSNLDLNSVAMVLGSPISIASFSYAQPET